MAAPTPSLLRPERARDRGRATWVTVLGLVLVPLVVGGLLTWALWKPTERLDRMQAAVVNLDEPVELNGQTVPLGRQLASALVTSGGVEEADDDAAADEDGEVANVSGSDSSGNFTWVLTDADDAAAGLADGTYATVVTIPAEFSAAATSYAGDAADAVRATIDIAASERSRLVDAAVAQAVTTTAVGLLNEQLTVAYLDNVLVGFTTLHDQLGQAADGAGQLADGAGQLGGGATQLADGTTSLADGIGQLAGGADQLSGGVSQLAGGASQLQSGIGQLASGADGLASGLARLADETSASAATAAASAPQVAQFTQGLDALVAGIAGDGGLASGITQLAGGAAQVQAQLSGAGAPGGEGLLDQYAAASVGCAAAPTPEARAAACAGAEQLRAGILGAVGQVSGGLAALDASVSQGTAGTPALTTSATQLAAGGRQLADGVTASASGLGTLAGYLQQSADGAAQLAAGARSAASGAGQLASGARSAASGAGQLAQGADEAAVGAGELSGGADQVADGVTSLAGGATELSDGLDQAVEQIPSYTDDEAATLADVVATPVAAEQGEDDGAMFGDTSVPFLAALALWLGALSTFVVIAAVPRRSVGSTRSSVALALQAFAPGALVGVVQGLAVAAIMAFALDLSAGGWAAFVAVCVVAAVAFAAVNQGLVALLGGVGRFVSVVVAVIGLAGAVVSTLPPLVEDLFAAVPLSPALEGMQGVVTGLGGAGAAVALLVVWGLAGLLAATAAIGRRRVVPAGQLARWSRA